MPSRNTRLWGLVRAEVQTAQIVATSSGNSAPQCSACWPPIDQP